MTRTPKLSRIYNILVYIFLYAPILTLIIFSFNDSKNRVVWSGFTLHWYADLFQNEALVLQHGKFAHPLAQVQVRKMQKSQAETPPFKIAWIYYSAGRVGAARKTKKRLQDRTSADAMKGLALSVIACAMPPYSLFCRSHDICSPLCHLR